MEQDESDKIVLTTFYQIMIIIVNQLCINDIFTKGKLLNNAVNFMLLITGTIYRIHGVDMKSEDLAYNLIMMIFSLSVFPAIIKMNYSFNALSNEQR